MRGLPLYIAAIAATATVGLLSVDGRGDPDGGAGRGIVGPDVVDWYAGGSGNLDMGHYGSGDGINAYAFGTTSCNWGDEEATWGSQGNESYPVIAQNCYRLADGRFEQIGLAWLKHSFCAVSEPGCGSCQSTPCSTLGIGCADTYWAGLNADATAPRSEINAYTGEYSYPFSDYPTGSSWRRGRLLLATADISDSSALYFIEGQYICSDEAAYSNQWNNCSWRQVQFNSITNPGAVNQTQVADPAIFAWKVHDPAVNLQMVQVPNDGRLHLGARAYDNGDGTFDYEYALHNMNSHRCVGTFSVPVGSATVTNVAFHDIDYHSGSVISSTDWTWQQVGNSLVFTTDSYASNQWANAVRWGSVYNFRFTTNTEPTTGDVDLGLFRPGTPNDVAVSTVVPLADPIDPCDLPLSACSEDVDSDGVVAVGDLLMAIGTWGDCGDGTYRPDADVDGDCCVTVGDLLTIIAAWGTDCTPRGACCLGDGGCLEWTSDAECVAAGGDWSGDGVACGDASCPAPGACCFDDGTCTMAMAGDCLADGGVFQGDGTDCKSADCAAAGDGDECDTAWFGWIGHNHFDTSDATPSQPQPDEGQCSGTYLDWDNSNDIWFTWTPLNSGSAYFTTCDPDSYDTSMVIYAGSCENQVACNGDADGSGCQAYHSAIDLQVQGGQTYYIRIGGWQGDNGLGTLTIDCPDCE